MTEPTTNLDVTPAERKKIRLAGIKKAEIHLHSINELQLILDVPKIRAMELFALSQFQSLPSIGIRFAHDLISMGYYSLSDLTGKDGAKLTDQFEKQIGAWADPCLEDQFRLVVHYARHPTSHKNWWDFTAERKEFRLAKGYPSTRPVKPWFALPQYQKQQLPNVKTEVTKKDLHKKLQKAILFMKKNLSEQVSLKALAEESSMSQYHFLRCFKSVYAKTPMQYLTHLRLKEACKLLRQTTLPINAVMLKTGFENDSSFIRLFKREFRVTPVVFRSEFGRIMKR